jgi:hypothetical protein
MSIFLGFDVVFVLKTRIFPYLNHAIKLKPKVLQRLRWKAKLESLLIIRHQIKSYEKRIQNFNKTLSVLLFYFQ